MSDDVQKDGVTLERWCVSRELNISELRTAVRNLQLAVARLEAAAKITARKGRS